MSGLTGDLVLAVVLVVEAVLPEVRALARTASVRRAPAAMVPVAMKKDVAVLVTEVVVSGQTAAAVTKAFGINRRC